MKHLYIRRLRWLFVTQKHFIIFEHPCRITQPASYKKHRTNPQDDLFLDYTDGDFYYHFKVGDLVDGKCDAIYIYTNAVNPERRIPS